MNHDNTRVGALELHKLWATFDDPRQEWAFDKKLFSSVHLKQAPTNLLSAALLFAALGWVDYLVTPSHWETAATLRYGLIIPLIVFLWLVARSRFLRGVRPLLPAMISWTGCIQYLFVGLEVGNVEGVLYQFFSVLFVLLPPLIGRSSVREAMWIGLGCFTILDIAMLMQVDPNPTVWLFIAATYVVCWGYAVHGAWVFHSAARRDFWQEQVIEWQLEQLDIERNKSDRLLLNVLPQSIAYRLKQSEVTIADSFADVTVLFADICGFTNYAAKATPEQLVERLNEIFTSFDELVSALGLEKIKTIGDAYMVASGLPVPDDNHAGKMCRFALGMLRAIERVNAETGESFAMRIGIHSGPVVAGVIGKQKFTYDLWGDTVNVASRMESHGQQGRIQISETTAEQVRGEFDVVERGVVDVKGKGEMRTYWLGAALKR